MKKIRKYEKMKEIPIVLFFSLLCRSMKRIVVVMKECIWGGERRQCENHRGEKREKKYVK